MKSQQSGEHHGIPNDNGPEQAPTATDTRINQKAHDDIQDQVKAFLANKGRITAVPSGASGNVNREMRQKSKKGAAASREAVRAKGLPPLKFGERK